MTYRVIFTNGYEVLDDVIFNNVVATRKMYRMISKMCKVMTAYELHRFREDLQFYEPVRVLRIYKVNH